MDALLQASASSSSALHGNVVLRMASGRCSQASAHQRPSAPVRQPISQLTGVLSAGGARNTQTPLRTP